MDGNPKILFLLVNYFNEKEVCAFVEEQLQPDRNRFIEIAITNNGGNKAELLQNLAQKNPTISLVTAGSNLGYFGAAYLGLTTYLKLHTTYPQAIIICNTDITLQADFFTVLQNKLTTQNFDVLGPSIYSVFLKYYQNPYITTRISKNKLKFLQFISSNYFLYSLFTLYHVVKTKVTGYGNSKVNKVTKPYAIHGSFIIFNRSFFEKSGIINYPSVLFGEEIFVAEQVLKLNLEMIYEPSLQVEHSEHATTGVFKSRRTVAYLHESYTYLLKTFFNV